MSCFVFRADGNSDIGLGHVMRCMSIADAAVEMGHDVCFVLADNSVEKLVRRRGFSTFVLGADYKDMESELGLWSGIASDDFGSVDIFLVVDSYYVTEKYLRELRQMRFADGRNCRLIYVDDLASFAYPVDVLVNYGFYADREVYEALYQEAKAEMPELLLGPEYAPLRKMFIGVEPRVQREEVRDVLISTGGSDPYHLVLEMMSELVSRAVFESYCTYHFLVGGMNEDSDAIRRMASGLSFVEVHEDVSDMKSLISSMDIVVSAAGSTQFEVCACGVPMVTYALADNQILGMEALENRGLAVSVGDLRSFTSFGVSEESVAEVILKAVEELAGDYEKRCEMGRRMQELVDGMGAERCVRGMELNENSENEENSNSFKLDRYLCMLLFFENNFESIKHFFKNDDRYVNYLADSIKGVDENGDYTPSDDRQEWLLNFVKNDLIAFDNTFNNMMLVYFNSIMEVVWYNYFLSFFDSLEYNVIKSKVKSYFCGGEIVNMVSLADRATAVSLATDQCCSGKCEKIIDRANLITGLDLSHETVEKLISLSKIRNDIVHETKMSICSDGDVSRYELVVYGTVERMGKHLIEVGAKVEDNGYFNWFDWGEVDSFD